jgi:hypothetical protein
MQATSNGRGSTAALRGKRHKNNKCDNLPIPALAKAFKDHNLVRTCRSILGNPCKLCGGEIVSGEEYYASTAFDKNAHKNCVKDIIKAMKANNSESTDMAKKKTDLSIVPSAPAPEQSEESIEAPTEMITLADMNFKMGKLEGWKEGYQQATREYKEQMAMLMQGLPAMLKAANCNKTTE